MRIETERLLIRPPELSDLESSCVIWTDPKVAEFLGGTPTIELIRKGFFADLEKAETDFGFRTVVERRSGSHVADCGLIQKDIEGRAEIELVYFVRSLSWGQGFATEAGRALLDHARAALGITRIVSLIHEKNSASARVAGKVGLKFEKNVVTAAGKS